MHIFCIPHLSHALLRVRALEASFKRYVNNLFKDKIAASQPISSELNNATESRGCLSRELTTNHVNPDNKFRVRGKEEINCSHFFLLCTAPFLTCVISLLLGSIQLNFTFDINRKKQLIFLFQIKQPLKWALAALVQLANQNAFNSTKHKLELKLRWAHKLKIL